VTAAAGIPVRSDHEGVSVGAATPADRALWDAFLAGQPAGDPLQAWAWGDVAATGGERPLRLIARDGGARVRAVAQLLVRPTAYGRQVLYAPHGPVWDRSASDAPELLDAILGAMAAIGRDERGIVIKVDPRTAAGEEPSTLRTMLEARGLRRARADLQARTTRVIDLRQGTDALFGALEKDTRNLVRRSAREGLHTRVAPAEDRAGGASFEALLGATGARAGFRVRPAQAFEVLQAGFGDGVRLVLAERDGATLAGCLALGVGRRAYYLYAAADRDPAHRHAGGAYAVLWALIEDLVASGYESLDLWGVAEPGDPSADPSWAGFSLFKRGFGGVPLEHPGTFDLVLSAPWHYLRDLRERWRR